MKWLLILFTISSFAQFSLTSPMEIKWISKDVYQFSLTANKNCSANVWWKEIDSTGNGEVHYNKYDKSIHTFIATNLPQNKELYVGATLTQETEYPRRTYQAGTYLNTNNFVILNTEYDAINNKVKVYATKESTIWFSFGKTADTVNYTTSPKDNPTQLEPYKWRHSALVPDGYTYWSARLQLSDGSYITTEKVYKIN